jgi:hypothetical protein
MSLFIDDESQINASISGSDKQTLAIPTRSFTRDHSGAAAVGKRRLSNLSFYRVLQNSRDPERFLISCTGPTLPRFLQLAITAVRFAQKTIYTWQVSLPNVG